MEYILFLHYFLVNLFYLKILPVMILLKKNEREYYSIIYRQSDGVWVAVYSKLMKKGEIDGGEILVEVKSRHRYILFMKMVFALWKIRDDIKITIDNY